MHVFHHVFCQVTYIELKYYLHVPNQSVINNIWNISLQRNINSIVQDTEKIFFELPAEQRFLAFFGKMLTLVK
jgi:hypothetical protein